MSFSGLVDDINAMLDTAQPPSTIDCCIYKVPSSIRKLNEDAYTPTVVSIGPFHHGPPWSPFHHGPPSQLQNMERHKLINFKAFLQRTNTTLHTFIHYINSILSDFRGCYSETLYDQDNDDLVRLILIDSGFIIQLFWTFHDGSYPVAPWLHSGIKSDLLLLENQLPFVVIEEIYKLSLSSTNASVPNTMIPSFLELTINYFQYFNKSNLSDNGRISIKHFTDLIRTFNLQHPIENLPVRVDIDIGMNHLPSVSELVEAGVRFEVKTERTSLLDFTFSGGVLKIPKLKVEDGTESLFRNMVALEQCYYPDKSYIIDYVAVMDYLINTGKDVDILVQSEILENCLGDSDSVANLFNGLCKNVNQSNISPHFSDLRKELNDFCSNRRNKWKASLRRDYCNSPWQTAASFAGIILLVLTFVQSVCSVWQLKKT